MIRSVTSELLLASTTETVLLSGSVQVTSAAMLELGATFPQEALCQASEEPGAVPISGVNALKSVE